jgi:two-component system, NtrC family, nitrogen regulation sensor histidine kinase GlnL
VSEEPAGFEALDQLATMVAVADPDGRCLRANSTLENVVGLSRRALQRGSVLDWLVDPAPLHDALQMVSRNEIASGRFDATMKRPAALGGGAAELPVHVIVSQTDRADRVLVELIEIEQQTRLDREERAHGLAQANKELVRNLAHEIKNPLGGIRGAAQLLAMELSSKELTEYTQVIIHEADRLQALVDRLLAPHRRPHVVSDVNIHEICERVRSLILAEFPRGLRVERDYDTSIPEFRGDREQLIQAVLNIAHNATQALAGGPADGDSPFTGRIARGDAQLILRTRVARQATFGRQRFRLALELHIQDNGPGVPEAIRDRIFHPLVSGREGGSGLGLTLAQTFVQQHQGTIECDSVPGRTVFKMLIPLP